MINAINVGRANRLSPEMRKIVKLTPVKTGEASWSRILLLLTSDLEHK